MIDQATVGRKRRTARLAAGEAESGRKAGRLCCSQNSQEIQEASQGQTLTVKSFEFFTRIVLSFRSYEITSAPFKRPPMRVDAPPYAHPRQPHKTHQRLRLWRQGLSCGQFSKTAPGPCAMTWPYAQMVAPSQVRRAFRCAFPWPGAKQCIQSFIPSTALFLQHASP